MLSGWQGRMAAMAPIHTEIERKLDRLQRQTRIVRQEEITAEIIELAANAAASRAEARRTRDAGWISVE